MITEFNVTHVSTNAEPIQSDHLSRRLPLAGANHQSSPASFDGGRVS